MTTRYEVTYTIEVEDHFPSYREGTDEHDLVVEAMEHAMITHGYRDCGNKFTFGSFTWKATARKLPGQVVKMVGVDAEVEG